MSLTPPPAEMIAENRWVLWRYREKDGKVKKVPYQASGAPASSTNPETWSSYDAVIAKHTGNDRYDGIGFALGDGWAGMDLDDVIVDGEMKPWAAEVIVDLNSYSEISPSGEGVKIFMRGKFDGPGKNEPQSDGSAVEMYCGGRYFTVTGNRYPDTPHEVRPVGAKLQHYYNRLCGGGELVRIDDDFENMKHRLLQMPESIDGQNGSKPLVAAACEIMRWGFDDEQAMDLLRFFDKERCIPAWGDYELGRALESAKKRVTEANGGTLPAKTKVPRVAFSLDLKLDKEFATEDFAQDFLVDNLIVAGEPLILGGPSKTMKTSILVDIAVSLANGSNCLGHFPVEWAHPVIIVSGESGGATLQKTAARVRDARGAKYLDNLYWGLRLPNLSIREHLDALRFDIERTGAKLVAIDPAYLSLLAGDDGDAAKNVFRMGIILNGFGQVGKDTGASLVLVHHFNKQVKQGQAPTLSNLSQSGFSEWARQWILLNHNKPYSQGKAQLKVNVGGSAGHGGNYLFDLDQGVQTPGGIGWTKWSVAVSDLDAPDFAKPPEDDKMKKRLETLIAKLIPGKTYTMSQLRTLVSLKGEDNAAAWVELEKFATTQGVIARGEAAAKANGNDSGVRYVATEKCRGDFGDDAAES